MFMFLFTALALALAVSASAIPQDASALPGTYAPTGRHDSVTSTYSAASDASSKNPISPNNKNVFAISNLVTPQSPLDIANTVATFQVKNFVFAKQQTHEGTTQVSVSLEVVWLTTGTSLYQSARCKPSPSTYKGFIGAYCDNSIHFILWPSDSGRGLDGDLVLLVGSWQQVLSRYRSRYSMIGIRSGAWAFPGQTITLYGQASMWANTLQDIQKSITGRQIPDTSPPIAAATGSKPASQYYRKDPKTGALTPYPIQGDPKL